MNSTRFKKQQLKKLASDLGVKSIKLKYIIENIDAFYDEYSKKKIDSKTGKPKTYLDGTEKERVIRPSKNELKFIQKLIIQKIFSKITLPNQVQGGLKGKSNITNAKIHQGNKYQFTTDLQNFYPSISNLLVYKTFKSLGFGSYYSSNLTKLTTWKNEVPQGAPTSSYIANLVFLETDKKLINFCNQHDITYSRFIDDLTFSSSKPFNHLTETIIDLVRSDFNMSYRKTIYGKTPITGIIAENNYIDAPQNIKLRAKLESSSNEEYKPITQYIKNIHKTNSKKLKKIKSGEYMGK